MRKLLPFFFILLFSFSFVCSSNEIRKDDSITSFENIIEYDRLINKKVEVSKNSPTLDYEVFGNQENFLICDFITETRDYMLATLLAVGSTCYVYVGNDSISEMGESEAIILSEIYRDEFDTVIYPKALEFAGHPDGILGDIDGDPHVTIMLYDISGVTGYYYGPNDDISYPLSNRREMIYMDIEVGILEGHKTLAHEFNHLIFFNYDLDDTAFMAEGIAEYSIYYTGYLSNTSYLLYGQNLNLTDFTQYFKDRVDVSLLCWDPYAPLNRIVNYGNAYLFCFYIAEKYGVDVLQDFIADENNEIESLESILLSKGYDITFNELYMNWVVTCIIDQPGIYNGLYSFDNAKFIVNDITEVQDLPTRLEEIEYEYYGLDIKKIDSPPDDFSLLVETPRDPYGLCVISIIEDDNGLNISKSIIFEDNDTIIHNLSGENIDYAYIATTIVKEEPNAPLTWAAPPRVKLNFTIYDYHLKHSLPTDESNYQFVSLIAVILVLVVYSIRKRKKTKL